MSARLHYGDKFVQKHLENVSIDVIAHYFNNPVVSEHVQNGLRLIESNGDVSNWKQHVALKSGHASTNKSKLGGWFDWIEQVYDDVAPYVKKGVAYCADNVGVCTEVGCAVASFFSWSPELCMAQQIQPDMKNLAYFRHQVLPAFKSLQTTDPSQVNQICYSHCEDCLSYQTPGFQDTFCLWSDWTQFSSSEEYCLQSCPSSGLSRTLLGYASDSSGCKAVCILAPANAPTNNVI